jgi:hypothetical protein
MYPKTKYNVEVSRYTDPDDHILYWQVSVGAGPVTRPVRDDCGGEKLANEYGASLYHAHKGSRSLSFWDDDKGKLTELESRAE